MSEQLAGEARDSDPWTSHTAAKSVDAWALMQKIYSVMEFYGPVGCTSEEVERVLPNILRHSITPRFIQMMRLGMIELTGESQLASTKHYQLLRRALPPPWTPAESKANKILTLQKRIAELEQQLDECRRSKA